MARLYLLSTLPIRKKYDMFYVFMCDGAILEYRLSEIKISIVDEWVEVERLDKTEMESFISSNIMRIKFMVSTNKLKMIKTSPNLLPVA